MAAPCHVFADSRSSLGRQPVKSYQKVWYKPASRAREFIKASWIMFVLELLLFLFCATGCESVVISSRDKIGVKFIPALCILNELTKTLDLSRC